jgi:hypothetical protein
MASAPVERLLARLKRVRKSGKGWAAFCPAHDDRSPSLSIAEGDDGRALVHCFAGCRGEEIARAVGLEVRDLFPDRDGDGQRSPPRRRDTCRPVSFPMSVAEVLVETGEFTTRVAVAEALASLEPRLARQDVLDNWDWLADRVDIPEAIALAWTFRGCATYRYVRAQDLDDPREIRRLEEKGVTDAREVHRGNVVRRAVERRIEELRD